MSPGQFLSWQSCTWLPSPGQPSPTSSFTQTLAYKCSIYMIVKGKRSMTNVVPIQYFGLQIAEILTLLFCPHPQVSVQLPQADQDVHPERIFKKESVTEMANKNWERKPGQGASVQDSVFSFSPSHGSPPSAGAVQARALLLEFQWLRQKNLGNLEPKPQVLLQPVHSPHPTQVPSTGWQISILIYLGNHIKAQDLGILFPGSPPSVLFPQYKIHWDLGALRLLIFFP